MSELLLKVIRSDRNYVWIGLITLLVCFSLVVAGAGLKNMVWVIADKRSFALWTGSVLAFGMAWQWRLFFLRRTGTSSRASQELDLHRWIGIAVIILFFAHAGSMGMSIRSLLSHGLLIVMASGLLHHILLKRIFPGSQAAWRWAHIGVSAAIMPFILVHIWASFAFKQERPKRIGGAITKNVIDLMRKIRKFWESSRS